MCGVLVYVCIFGVLVYVNVCFYILECLCVRVIFDVIVGLYVRFSVYV